MRIRRARRVVLISCVWMGVAFTGSAAATVVTYSGDGSTLIVSDAGANGNHQIQFRANGANDDIIDNGVAFTTIPGDCAVVAAPYWISCPAHVAVKVDLGAGNDTVTFGGSQFDCFNTYTVNLGDGDNTTDLYASCPTSPAETATLTSGSGSDTLMGGNQSAITFNAGAGNDNVYGGSGNDILHGGDGNDRLFGGAGNDQVLGEGGNDAVNGGAGNDLVDGGAGDDNLEYCDSCYIGSDDPGLGADTYVGGDGTDKLWLDQHAGGMNISLDGQANDGSPGEGDNVGSDIEAITGGPGNDTFTGSAGPDQFDGYLGNDVIHGGGGNDQLYGGDGNDQVYGDAGNDKVQGDAGADIVDGGPGTDQLYGDVAGCFYTCSPDSDTLMARDGEKDSVDCGGGASTAQVDFVDVVTSCASVDRSPAPAPAPACGTSGANPCAAPAAMTFGVRTVGALRIAGPLGLVVTCSAACHYKLAVILSAKTARRFGLGSRPVTIGTASGALPAAGNKHAKLTLSAKARRRLKHASAVAATLRLTVTDAAGKASARSRSITLHR